MRDTSDESERMRIAAIRALSPGERVRNVLDWSDAVRAMAVSRVRRQNPDWSELEAVEHLLGAPLIPPGHPARRA